MEPCVKTHRKSHKWHGEGSLIVLLPASAGPGLGCLRCLRSELEEEALSAIQMEKITYKNTLEKNMEHRTNNFLVQKNPDTHALLHIF